MKKAIALYTDFNLKNTERVGRYSEGIEFNKPRPNPKTNAE